MMYQITFVFRGLPEDPREEALAAMKSLGAWSDRLQPTFLLECDLSSAKVRDSIKPHLKPRDRVFVGELSRNWAATGMGEGFGEWMKRRNTIRFAGVSPRPQPSTNVSQEP